MYSFQDVLGEDFKSYPLKSIRRRLQQKLSWATMPKDPVRLVVTKDGRKYKLIAYRKETKTRTEFIFRHRSFLESLDFVPTIVYLDNPETTDTPILLVEFVEGSRPEITSLHFAKELGFCLAQLHKYKLDSENSELFIKKLTDKLDILEKNRLITQIDSLNILNRLYTLTPKNIPNAIINGDLQPDNFIFDNEGKLKFIDLGAFRYGIPGYALIESDFYNKINKESFIESYLESGGTDFFINNEPFLFLSSNITNSANSLEIASKLPFYEIKRKIRRKRHAKKGINNILEIL